MNRAWKPSKLNEALGRFCDYPGKRPERGRKSSFALIKERLKGFPSVRCAKNITEAERDTFERYGEHVIGTMIAGGFVPDWDDLKAVYKTEETRQHVRDWLTERADSREIREEWKSLRHLILELLVIGLIGFEIVLSVIGLRAGYQQGKVLDKQTSALTHMDTSTAATVDSLQKLVAAQDASLKILQEEQAQRAKKPRLVLYVGSMPIDKTTLQLAPRTGLVQDTASFDLLVKNVGDAPVSTFRLHVLTPEGVGLDADQLIIVPQIGPPAHLNTQVLTLQLPLLPAGEMYRLHIAIYALKGDPAFRIKFTVDAIELQAEQPSARSRSFHQSPESGKAPLPPVRFSRNITRRTPRFAK